MDHLVRASHGSYLGVHFPGELQTALRAADEPPGRWASHKMNMLYAIGAN